MELQELRALSVEDLKGRVKQWKDDLFRARFKAFSNEIKDTSVFKKLKKDVARAYTVLTEKASGNVVVTTSVKKAIKKAAPIEDKPQAPKEKKVQSKAPKKTSKSSTKKGKE